MAVLARYFVLTRSPWIFRRISFQLLRVLYKYSYFSQIYGYHELSGKFVGNLTIFSSLISHCHGFPIDGTLPFSPPFERTVSLDVALVCHACPLIDGLTSGWLLVADGGSVVMQAMRFTTYYPRRASSGRKTAS